MTGETLRRLRLPLQAAKLYRAFRTREGTVRAMPNDITSHHTATLRLRVSCRTHRDACEETDGPIH